MEILSRFIRFVLAIICLPVTFPFWTLMFIIELMHWIFEFLFEPMYHGNSNFREGHQYRTLMALWMPWKHIVTLGNLD